MFIMLNLIFTHCSKDILLSFLSCNIFTIFPRYLSPQNVQILSEKNLKRKEVKYFIEDLSRTPLISKLVFLLKARPHLFSGKSQPLTLQEKLTQFPEIGLFLGAGPFYPTNLVLGITTVSQELLSSNLNHLIQNNMVGVLTGLPKVVFGMSQKFFSDCTMGR